MRKRKQQVMKKTLTRLSRSSKTSSTSGGGYFDLIPVDLIIKIFSKSSVKSLGKFRCVSKLWSSITRRPNYNQLFPIKSPEPPPRLFFVLETGNKLYFYSIPQPEKKLDDNLSITATLHHAEDSRGTGVSDFCRTVNGLVCHQRTESGNHTVVVISNPITGESITLPTVVSPNWYKAQTYFGYDPINKTFKVLYLTWWPLQHQVITLETTGQQLLWRKIPCCKSYYPQRDGICINGVLYYTAFSFVSEDNSFMIICFDVMSERFDFITERN